MEDNVSETGYVFVFIIRGETLLGFLERANLSYWTQQMAVRLSALCPGRALLPRNIIFLLLVLISVV
jgi:hypothetical protein